MADSGFADVAGNPHTAAIDCLAWWEAVRGRSPTVYAPAAEVRRDQMASFVVNMMRVAGIDAALIEPTEELSRFDDVDPATCTRRP